MFNTRIIHRMGPLFVRNNNNLANIPSLEGADAKALENRAPPIDPLSLSRVNCVCMVLWEVGFRNDKVRGTMKCGTLIRQRQRKASKRDMVRKDRETL